MFRKAVASLLVLLLLTGCAILAHAESGYVFAISFEASEDQMAAYDRDLGGDGKTGAAIAQFLNTLSLSASTSEENTAVVRISAGETASLLDAAVRVQENGLLQLASNLFPGVRLEMNLASDENLRQWSNLAACISAAAEKLSAQSVSLRGEAMLFFDSLNPEVESGVFSGDAYTGGVERYTYRFDNRDLAALLLRLLNRVEGMDEVFSAYGFDWNETKREWTDMLADFADKNEVRYMVRIVYGEPLNPLRSYQPNPIGLSVTVFRGEEQIVTLSEGVTDQQHKLVIGFGYENQVYMLDVELNGSLVTDSVDLTGSVRLWQDPYREGYRAASSDERNLLAMLTLDRLTLIVNQGFTAVYDATLNITGKKSLRETGRIQLKGTDISCVCSLYYDHADAAMLTLHATGFPGEALFYAWPEETVIRMEDDSAALIPFMSSLVQGITDLNSRLQTALPSELYSQFMNWLDAEITELLDPANFD